MKLLKQILGWILFFVGIFIIFYTLYSSYSIFTGVTPPPQLFKFSETFSSQTKNFGMGEILKKIIGEQFEKMFPPQSLSTLLNLISWSILAFILIAGGGKISIIGINLLK